MTHPSRLPPGQQWVAAGKWPAIGERAPRECAGTWTISVTGCARTHAEYTLAELAALPRCEQVVDLHCVTRWSKPAVRFAGVKLATLLDAVCPTPEARFVSFVARSERQHSTSLPLADAVELQTLLALEAEGAPLPVERGGPLRVVVPRRYFYKSLKWLARIELLEHDRLGYWEATAGYHNTADPWRQQRYVASNLSPREITTMLATRDISDRELPSLSAAGLELSGLVARRATLRNADFRRGGLRGACFDRANLTNAHFEGADLRAATFLHADLEGTNFAGADLRGACLLGASLVAASFCDASKPHAMHPARFDAQTRFFRNAIAELMPQQQDFLLSALSAAGAVLG